MRSKLLPEIERTHSHAIKGLTLLQTTTRAMTYTVKQLKRIAMTDKLGTYAMTNEQRKDLIITLIQDNRHDLFGVFAVYAWKITFNGYGQLRKIQCNELTLTPNQLFDKLDNIYLTA